MTGNTRPPVPDLRRKRSGIDPVHQNEGGSGGIESEAQALWLGCGTEDFAYAGVKAMDDLLTKKNVKHAFNPSGGGHSWPNWQVYLSKYAPLLFRD